MIGLPIGATPIGGLLFSIAPVATPNIILSGTLDFGYSFRIPNRIATYLNFSAIIGDDNTVQVNLTNSVTGEPIQISSVDVSIYAPGTITGPVLTPAGTVLSGGFQFTIPRTNSAVFSVGHYPWIAIVTLLDGTEHTVNCGDINLTTGLINVVERP